MIIIELSYTSLTFNVSYKQFIFQQNAWLITLGTRIWSCMIKYSNVYGLQVISRLKKNANRVKPVKKVI